MNTKTRSLSPARRMTTVAMLAAVSYALMWACRPIPAVSGFLQFDLKDIPVVMAGFMFGPMSSVAVSATVSLLELVTVSDSGFIGLVMNMLSSCAFACTAAAVYRRRQSMGGAAAGLISGVPGMAAVMLLWNYIMVPLYTPAISRETVAGMLLPLFLPFNLLKGGTNAALTMLLYKPFVTALRAAGLAPVRQAAVGGHAKRGPWLTAGVIIAALFVAATCLLTLLVWTGVL